MTMFRKNFLRSQKDPFESMGVLYDLAEEYIAEDTPVSLFAAYKILSTLEDNFPEKASQGALGRTLSKLDKMGLFQQILDYEKQTADKSENDEKINAQSANNIKLKLVGLSAKDVNVKSKLFENKNKLHDMKVLSELANNFLKEGTTISLISAYKIFSTLKDNNANDTYQSSITTTLAKLKSLGIHEDIVKYEKHSEHDEETNAQKAKSIKSKL